MSIESEPSAPTESRGDSLWALQVAQAISMIADVSVMWILMWWLLLSHKAAATTELLLMLLGPGLLTYIVLLPLAGTLADALPRRQLAIAGCLLRVFVHVGLGVLLATGLLSPEHLYLAPILQIANAAGGALFDASSVAMVPELLPDQDHERGVGYALLIPRAGFLFTGFFCVFLLGVTSAPTAAFAIGGMLLLAVMLMRIQPAGTSGASTVHSAKDWLRLLITGPLAVLRSPRLLWIASLTGLLSFTLSPFHTLAPVAPSGSGAPQRPKDFPESAELCVALGVIIGAWATQRLTRRATPAQVVGGSFMALAASLFLLAQTHVDRLAYVACIVIGIALMQIVSLTGISAILSAENAARGRVVALLTAVYEAGGELGRYTLLPQLAAHGSTVVLGILAVVLGLLIGPALLVSKQSLGVPGRT